MTGLLYGLGRACARWRFVVLGLWVVLLVALVVVALVCRSDGGGSARRRQSYAAWKSEESGLADPLASTSQRREVPALATKITDRVGAGDAVLAVTSLMVARQAPWEVVGFVGNCAGAQLVAELGNRVVLNKVQLQKQITSLMS